MLLKKLKDLLKFKNKKEADPNLLVTITYNLYKDDELETYTKWGNVEEDKDIVRIATFYYLINSGQTSNLTIEAIKEITKNDEEIYELATQVMKLWEYLKVNNPQLNNTESEPQPLIKPSSALTADSKN